MKKKKLILSSMILALTLAFVSMGATNAYADQGDPQGVVEKKSPPPPPPPPPPSPIDAIVAFILSLLS